MPVGGRWTAAPATRPDEQTLLPPSTASETVTERLRRLVAEANRLLYVEGLAAASGHVSALDRESGVVHVNPFDVPRGELRPGDVVGVTLDGDPVDPAASRPVDEVEIHAALYRARDDVDAVVHVHPPVATLFGIAGVDLVPVHIRGSVLDGPVPVLDRPDKITDRDDGAAMVAAMDGSNQLLVRGHGAVVADRDVRRAFVRAVVVEENARYQLYASILGDPVAFDAEEAARIRAQNWGDRSVEKRWEFYRWKARRAGFLPVE